MNKPIIAPPATFSPDYKSAPTAPRVPSALSPSKVAAPSGAFSVTGGSDAFGATADSEIAEHMNKFLDELKWFREHSIKIHLSPTATGWNLKFSVPEK